MLTTWWLQPWHLLLRLDTCSGSPVNCAQLQHASTGSTFQTASSLSEGRKPLAFAAKLQAWNAPSSERRTRTELPNRLHHGNPNGKKPAQTAEKMKQWNEHIPRFSLRHRCAPLGHFIQWGHWCNLWKIGRGWSWEMGNCGPLRCSQKFEKQKSMASGRNLKPLSHDIGQNAPH